MLKWTARPYLRVDKYEIANMHSRNLKVLLKNHWTNFNQSKFKTSLVEWDSNFVQMKNHSILIKKKMSFSSLNQHCDNLCIYRFEWFFRWALWPIGLLLLFSTKKVFFLMQYKGNNSVSYKIAINSQQKDIFVCILAISFSWLDEH